MGKFAKAWAAWTGGILTILTMVSAANLFHGKYAVWLAIAIAGLTSLVAVPIGVYKVPNTPDNLVADAKIVTTEVVPEVKSVAAQVQADLHGGAAQAAPWPTATPPATLTAPRA